MTLYVRTARITCTEPDCVDITRKSAPAWAEAFAPSWAILGPALDARKQGRDEAHWPHYVEQYVDEMRASYRRHATAWNQLLAMPSATLVCYCTDPERCHRTVLARDILPKLGAEYEGEAPSPSAAAHVHVLMRSR